MNIAEQKPPYMFGLKDRRVPPALANLLWFFHGFTARVNFIITPFFQILASMQIAEQINAKFAISCLIKIFVILFGLLLNFSTFTLPNQKYLYPDPEIRQSLLRTYKMFLNYNVVFLIVVLLYELDNFIAGQTFHLDLYLTMYLSIFSILWLVEKIVSIANNRSNDRKSDVYEKLDNVSSAYRKIKSRLTKSEKQELFNLIYEDYEISRTNISRAAQVLWLSIIFALIIQLLQTFLGDYVRSVFG